MKESRQPSDHYFVIQPSFNKLPQHELIMFLPQSWQNLIHTKTRQNKKAKANVNSGSYE